MQTLRIQEITFGELQEKKANGINWEVGNLQRGATEAIVYCDLIYVNEDGSNYSSGASFTMQIPNTILQQWGSDDSVIDNFVLSYSPLFVKQNQ